jgi:hypothetical protein
MVIFISCASARYVEKFYNRSLFSELFLTKIYIIFYCNLSLKSKLISFKERPEKEYFSYYN